MPCWRQKKKKKPNVDYISSTEGNWEVIYSLLLSVLWLGKSIFLTQWFYILSVFNMERYLACPASLAVFINQDNQYQQNKQEKNIMIKCKWAVKGYFQKSNTNEKHRTIIFIFFSKVIYLLRKNLSKSASVSGCIRTTKIY